MWRNKVLWTEGLFLRPQHFHQQERYFEQIVDRRSKAMASWTWGFESLEIDEASLTLGKLALRSAAGVLPDGTVFAVPQDDLPPPALDVGESLKNTLVYLAIALDRPGVPNTSLGDTSGQLPIRCAPRDSEVPDITEGFDESAPMQLGALRLRLLPGNELSGAYAAMPVARIVERRSDGQLLIDRQFIAPALSCSDTPTIRGWIEELRGKLNQRSEILAAAMTQPGRGGVAEIADFLLLQTVNRHLAVFEHLFNVPRLHPDRLYTRCVELAGDLTPFGAERRLARPFPAYDHDDLELTFRPVLEHLRRALAMQHEKSAIRIDLRDLKHGVRVAVIPDKTLITGAAFVLAVNAQMPSEALRLRLPTQTKIGPVERIRDLVNLQLPGVALRPLPVAPRQIPFHAGFNYFELDTRHELWHQLPQSGGLALHVSGEFPGIDLELWAIRG